MGVIYYFLENYNLDEVEIESDLMVDGRREITFKRVGTDEGGREQDDESVEVSLPKEVFECNLPRICGCIKCWPESQNNAEEE